MYYSLLVNQYQEQQVLFLHMNTLFNFQKSSKYIIKKTIGFVLLS